MDNDKLIDILYSITASLERLNLEIARINEKIELNYNERNLSDEIENINKIIKEITE